MATVTTTHLTDDLDGSEAANTVRFGWQGREYEIDLNEKHELAFEKAVAKYVQNARRVGSTMRRRPVKEDDTLLRRTIREWAVENGLKVPQRGRLPQSIVDAYNAS